MWRVLCLAAGPALLVITGLFHGVWTHRWGGSAAVERAVARLAAVPETIGDWKSTPDKMDEQQRVQAGIEGYVQRTYFNPKTGTELRVTLVCGHSGPICVHTPDVCYRGAGYIQVAPETVHPIAWGEDKEEQANFWMARFRRPEHVAPGPDSYIRILWAWNATGKWDAPKYPRLVLTRHPALYKLYVIRNMAKEDEPMEGDPTVQFLPLLMAELQRCLFPTE